MTGCAVGPHPRNAAVTAGGPVHGSAVCLSGRAALIVGPSGSGKSALALALMSMGAGLIADDRTIVTEDARGTPIASCPPTIAGRIEVRGVGIFRVPPAAPAPLVLVVDLGCRPRSRLPGRSFWTFGQHRIPAMPAAGLSEPGRVIALWLRSGPPIDPDAPPADAAGADGDRTESLPAGLQNPRNHGGRAG